MRKFTKTSVALGAAGLLVLGGVAAGASAQAEPTVHTVASTSTKIPAPMAAVPQIFGGSTSVALDSDFLAALKSLGLTPSVAGDATLDGSDISFPITGGSMVYWNPDGKYRPYVQGILEHDGSGLNLTAGSTKVTLENFTINPGNSKLYGDVLVNGKVAATQAYLFNLWGGTLKPLTVDGNVGTLTGTTVHISPDAAKLLDDTFKTDAVKSGLLVGTATIAAEIAE